MKMRFIIYVACVVVLGQVYSQNITFGGNSTFVIGSQASFYAGGNTTFNGVLTNNGEIISFSDLDFVDNRTVGSLKFVGDDEQTIYGDSLTLDNVEVDKPGNTNINLETDQVVIAGMLNVTNGVIQSQDSLGLLVSGSSVNTGSGFVSGKLVGLTTANALTFPMGIGESPNYITLSNTNSGIILEVECLPAETSSIRLDEESDVLGVFDEVEWRLTSLREGETTNANLAIDFSGVDAQLADGNFNRLSDAESVAIFALVEGDSIFRQLSTVFDNTSNRNPPNFGSLDASDNLVPIGNEPVRIIIGYIPIATEVNFFVPNAFAPNGMITENRTFRPFFGGSEVTSVTMSVFNSLSTEVYTASQSGNNVDLRTIAWDGTLNSGQEAPGGVYYYKISLTSPGGDQSKNGSVLLVR